MSRRPPRCSKGGHSDEHAKRGRLRSSDSATLALRRLRVRGAGDGAAGSGVQAEDERPGWQANVGVPLSGRRASLGTAAGGRVCESGRGDAGAASRARAAASSQRAARADHAERARRGDLAQHEAQPRTIAKLRWLLAKAVCAFGDRRVVELRSDEIAAWRAGLPAGHRFEATQALRQVLNRAVAWRIIDSNPARAGVDNPRRQHPEKRPFETWAEIDALAAHLDPAYGPMIVFAATGLRPGEWIALEQRDLDREARVVYVRRALAHGQLKNLKTRRCLRAVPLQSIALDALDRLPARGETPLLFPAPRGGYPRPAQLQPPRLESLSARRWDRAS